MTISKRIAPESLFVVVVWIFSIFANANASAGELLFQPFLRVGGLYNDNLRLHPDDQLALDVTGVEAEVRLRITNESETGIFRFVPAIVATQFPDSRNDDYEDYYLTLFGRTEQPRLAMQFGARYWREGILDSELDDLDFDNQDVPVPGNTDSGLVGLDDTRELVSINPAVSFIVSERTSIGLTANYRNVDYLESSTSGLIGYDDGDAGINLVRGLTEKNTLTFRLYGSLYEADQIENTGDGKGVEVRFERSLSEQTDVYVQGGYVLTDLEFENNGSLVQIDTDTTTFAAGFVTGGEISRWIGDVRHGIDPSASGVLTERSQIRLRYSRQLSPMVTGLIDVRLQNVDPLVGNTSQVDRDFGRVALELAWRISRFVSLEAGYSYTKQDFESTLGDATGNELRFGITYEPRRRD